MSASEKVSSLNASDFTTLHKTLIRIDCSAESHYTDTSNFVRSRDLTGLKNNAPHSTRTADTMPRNTVSHE